MCELLPELSAVIHSTNDSKRVLQNQVFQKQKTIFDRQSDRRRKTALRQTLDQANFQPPTLRKQITKECVSRRFLF
jgi:hypothetical protein